MGAVRPPVGSWTMGRQRNCARSYLDPQEAWLTVLPGGCFRAKMTFPQNYPLYPPKMKFETPIFHPNGKPSITSTNFPTTIPNLLQLTPPISSLRKRRSLHLHPPPTRRRPIRLRERQRALVARAISGVHFAVRHQHARQPERRERGEHRGRQALARGPQGVQEEGEEVCA